jgi:hypothetical protein
MRLINVWRFDRGGPVCEEVWVPEGKRTDLPLVRQRVGPAAAAAPLRLALERNLRTTQDRLRRELADPSGPTLPASWEIARHEAGHAVAAMVLGLQLVNVVGDACYVMETHDLRDAIFALAGQAAGSAASPSDLARAEAAMAGNARCYDWAEMRRRARVLVAEWQLGIDAVARQLSREGLLTSDEVWATLEKVYRSEAPRFGDTLRAVRRSRAA